MKETASTTIPLDSKTYLTLVQEHLDEAITKIKELSPTSSDQYWVLLQDLINTSICGGKRLRALCVQAGYLLTRSSSTLAPKTSLYRLAQIGAATELYQASALTHDDIIDNAQLRRGHPTTHVQANKSFPTDIHCNHDFGRSCAILVGDITYAMAQQTLISAVEDHERPIEILNLFTEMSKRVSIGQYLDVVADYLPVSQNLQPERPLEVIKFKTAGYSVIDPVCLGALHAGASKTEIQQLREAISDWGIAFQLRDDQLGVFSTATESGKPQYQDILEGKRTYLLVKTLQQCSSSEAKKIAEVYSRSSRTTTESALVAKIMQDSGARDLVDQEIDQLYHSGREKLLSLHFPSPQALLDLSEKLVYRQR